MNKLILGFSKTVEPAKRGLFIHDEVPSVPRARIFDPTVHSFNPLKGIDYKTARQLAEVLFTIYPQGENTLTVKRGKMELLPALRDAGRLDKVTGGEEVTGMIGDILQSPVLKKVFCSSDNQFSFKQNSLILARINRAELGDFDALVLYLFLMAHFKGQLIVPDGGFCLRDPHMSLIREERLIVGLNFLNEVSPKLRNGVLLIPDKEASGATFQDAEVLADYARIQRGTVGYNAYIDEQMG